MRVHATGGPGGYGEANDFKDFLQIKDFKAAKKVKEALTPPLSLPLAPNLQIRGSCDLSRHHQPAISALKAILIEGKRISGCTTLLPKY